MIEGPNQTPKHLTGDPELAKKFPQPEQARKEEKTAYRPYAVDPHGNVHFVNKPEDVAELNQDELEAA